MSDAPKAPAGKRTRPDAPAPEPPPADPRYTRRQILQTVGAAAAATAIGVALLDRDDGVRRRTLRAGQVFYPFVEADRIINVPCVKHHGLTRATLSMKNWYGVLGGQRVLLHQDIHRSIVDLARMIKPTLTVLDATRALTANGPSGGSLDDVRRLDTIAASVDEVALDAFGAGFLEVAPADLGYLAFAEAAGLGTRDFGSLKMVEVAG